MTLSPLLQPDQNPQAWSDHVFVYEAAFEPLTNQFAAAALDRLAPLAGLRLLDVAAGAGGAALLAAQRGAFVTALDLSGGMVERIAERARLASQSRVQAMQMDAAALALPDASFDAGLSVLGIVLVPDVAQALCELRRVLKKGAPIALVTWTQPHRYELASRLRDAICNVCGEEPRSPSGVGPAQLRFTEPAVFRKTIESGGFHVETLEVIDAFLPAPNATWLGEHLAFAPGLSASMAALGTASAAVVEAFVARLKKDQGHGAVRLAAVAQMAIARA